MKKQPKIEPNHRLFETKLTEEEADLLWQSMCFLNEKFEKATDKKGKSFKDTAIEVRDLLDKIVKAKFKRK